MRKILLVGATSAIAKAVARHYASQGVILHLLGRDAAKLKVLEGDLMLRGASQVSSDILDMNELAAHEPVLERAWLQHAGFDMVLLAHGTLPNQEQCAADVTAAVAAFTTNATATIAFLTCLAPRLRSQGHGTLAVITSVAGDRGRASNYLYGAAKAAVATYLQGLRQALARDGVRVLTIKPGFVDTPMTAHLRKGPLWVQPETIAAGIAEAVETRRNIVYLPGIWRLIMAVICAIPEPLFRKLKL